MSRHLICCAARSRMFGFYAVLIASTGVLADTAFFSSTQRTTGIFCSPPLDISIQPASGQPIPAGSTVNGVTFVSPNSCDTSGCGPYQFRLTRISISHGGVSRSVPDGTWHDFDGLDASGTWSTGIEVGQWGCPATVGWGFSVTYTPPPPPLVITGLNPDNCLPPGGIPVTISGRNFTPDVTVSFDPLQVPFTFVNSTTLTTTAPPHDPGQVLVRVQRGGLSSTHPFRYVAPPTVTAVTPDHGATAGGTPVTITGTNFAPGAEVFFDGSYPATQVAFVNSTTLTATTPAHTAAGSVRVTVFIGTFGGVRENAFTYVAPPPTVTAVSPDRGNNTGGTSVTITGTNFAPGATVTFGEMPGTGVTFVDGGTLRVTTPAHRIGQVDVAVTVIGQTGLRPNAFTYVVAPAQIMSVVNTLLQ